MSAEVHFFAAARAAVGASVLQVPPGTLNDVLNRVESEHPGFATVRPQCSFLINGTVSVDPEHRVDDGARLDVLPPFAGG
jgi:molybdopterin converting factor small subunit